YELDGPEKAKEVIQTAKHKLNNDPSKLKLGEIHLLIKFYKDCSTYLHSDSFDRITEAIEGKYQKATVEEPENSFDVFALKFALNYTLNNQLSDIIAKNSGDESK